MINHKQKCRYSFINSLLFSFIISLTLLNICGTASAECLTVPEQLTVIDKTENATEAPMVFDNETFTLDFPSYCTPVDIYVAIFSPTNKLIFVDAFGGLTLDFVPYAVGTTSAINTAFPIGNTPLASEITGECPLYWLVSPTNGGDLLQSLNEAVYDLGISALFRMEEIPRPDIVLAIPTDVNKLTIAWLPIDDVEKYDIHMSTSEKYIPDDNTLYKTVPNKTQIEITDLETATTYYFTVLAHTHSGEIIPGKNFVAATTFSSPSVLNANNTVNTSDTLNLGDHSVNGDQLTYSKSQNVTIPEIDSIIVSQNNKGEGVLRRVDDVSTTSSQIILQTSPASLSDVFEQGSISSKLTLFDVDAVTRSKPAQSKLKAKQIWNDKNERVSTLSWDDNLLAAKQIDYIHDDDKLLIQPAEEPGRYDIKLRSPKSVSESVSLSASVSFVPEITTELAWSGGLFSTTLERAKLVASGTLSFDANAAYNFSAEANYEPEDRELFSRTFPVRYFIGGVPVLQTITLTVKAQISAHALAEISASAHANVSEQVAIGVEYNRWTGEWIPIAFHRESQSLETDISINGSVDALVKLIPEIEVQFYSTVVGSMTVEPFLKAELKAEDITNEPAIVAALNPRLIHPTQFDVKMGLDSYMSASLTIIEDEYDYTFFTNLQLLHFDGVKLFSLPQLNLSRGESRITEEENMEVELILNATNGVNNTFDPATVEWMVIPENPPRNPTITQMHCSQTENGAECSARILIEDQDTYYVLASGNGIIGEVARQYAITKIVRGTCGEEFTSNGEFCEKWSQHEDGDHSYCLSYDRTGYTMDGIMDPFRYESFADTENLEYEEIDVHYSLNDENSSAKTISVIQNFYDNEVDRNIWVWVHWSRYDRPIVYIPDAPLGRSATPHEYKIYNGYYIWKIWYRGGGWMSPASETLTMASIEDVLERGVYYKSEYGEFESVEHWIESRGLMGQYIQTTPPSRLFDCSWWNHTDPETGNWVSGCR